MDGFKNSTKTQYFQGGHAGAKGAAKVSQTMRAFKAGGVVKKSNGGDVAAPAVRGRTDEIMAQQAARRTDMQARMADRAARQDARNVRVEARQAEATARKAENQADAAARRAQTDARVNAAMAQRPGVPGAPSNSPAIPNRQTPTRPGFAVNQAAMKKGGKAEAKVAKVMKEFGAGKLHSGSKKGPEVTNPKQAVAIALSEARKAPVKRQRGTPIGSGPERGSPEADDVLMAHMTDAEIAAGAAGVRSARARLAKREREYQARMAPKPKLERKSKITGILSGPEFDAARREMGYKQGGLSAMPKRKGGRC